MKTDFSYTDFFKELETSLIPSNVEKRQMWAATIIEKDLDLKDLSRLLKCERKIAIRFLWLLSEIGGLRPDKLFSQLPFLLNLCEHTDSAYTMSFATFWCITGVPPENEGRAIDLLFHWLVSADTNVTTKSRALLVLFKLTEKYPELKNELKLCLSHQMDKHTKEFEKRAARILRQLEQD